MSGTTSPGRGREAVPVVGVNAARALLDLRMEDVIRIHVTEARVPVFADALRRAAKRRIPYHVVAEEDVERVSESLHHEGICVLARPPRLLDPEEATDLLRGTEGRARALVLVNVRNPHNLGSILRVGAHFGASVAFLTGPDGRKGLTPAGYRMAEGGAEHVRLAYAGDPPRAYEALRAAGFRILATTAGGAGDLYAARIPDRAAVAFGAEAEGLPPAAIRAADLAITIPGTGLVQSLNVAAASAAILGEIWRRHAATRDPGRGTSR